MLDELQGSFPDSRGIAISEYGAGAKREEQHEGIRRTQPKPAGRGIRRCRDSTRRVTAKSKRGRGCGARPLGAVRCAGRQRKEGDQPGATTRDS